MTLALYRRYRPQTFAELVGQDHVTSALQNALAANRVHHAYLFSGPRGCGKTSSARILARSLNCEQGPTPTPCGTCEQCVAIAAGTSLDVVEIDAASHGGVDDARDLRERAFFSPVSARFKIYIVDEAHMVTPAGFNALLKVVEEPPEFLKFVFATTEPQSVIGTIKSRTHHYPFRLVPPKLLSAHLEKVCAEEGVHVDPRALGLVVRAGGGSVRDALSVLDQLLAGAGDEGLTYDSARALLGVTDEALVDEMVDALTARDGAAVFETIATMADAGHDPRRFATDLLDRFRDVMVVQRAPDAIERGMLDLAPDSSPRLQQQAAALTPAEASRAADLLYAGLTEMRGTTSPRLVLELMCARILLPGAAADEQALLARLDRLERRLEISGDAPAPARPPAVVPAATAGSARASFDVESVGAAAPEPAASRPAGQPPAGLAPPRSMVPTPDNRMGGPSPDPAPTPVPAAPATPGADLGVEPSAEPRAAEPASGGLDAAAVRRVWPEVLAALTTKTARALLADATVAGVEGSVLTLSFARPWGAQRFSEGVNAETLREALATVLGVDWSVRAVVRDDVGGAATPVPRSVATPTAQPAGPADEASEVSDDDEAVGASGADGSRAGDDPVALLRSGLGATVIGEIEPS
jgi:DNA polymerase III subunit gamma/tau